MRPDVHALVVQLEAALETVPQRTARSAKAAISSAEVGRGASSSLPVAAQYFVVVFGPWRRVVEVEQAPLQPGPQTREQVQSGNACK